MDSEKFSQPTAEENNCSYLVIGNIEVCQGMLLERMQLIQGKIQNGELLESHQSQEREWRPVGRW